MEQPEGRSPFLKPGRLTDVKALIDHLARHPDYSQRSENALARALGPPASAPRWTTVVDEHPQFFENAGGDYPLILRERRNLCSPLTAKQIEGLHDRATSYDDEARPAATSPHNSSHNSKVFIVHGRGGREHAVAEFLRRLGLEPVILHERANEGRTVIEKFEAHSDVGFAVVLITPDDVGGLKGGEQKPRARQNVILELGYFVGRLGRSKVCPLVQHDVEWPSDILGVTWVPFDTCDGWHLKLAKELHAAGCKVDLTRAMA